MPLIICTKFQINQVIVTLFSGVWDKNPTLTAEEVVKGRFTRSNFWSQLLLKFKEITDGINISMN